MVELFARAVEKIKDLGRHIQRTRKLWELSRQQLAEKTGVSVGQIHAIETNSDSARLGATRKILEHFFLKLEYVVKWKDEL